MSDQFRTERFDDPAPFLLRHFPPLPAWLGQRVLRREEQVTWVIGPRWQPPGERLLTHPLLFVGALVFGVVCIGVGRLLVQEWSALPPLLVLFAGGVVMGALFVVGIASGYFTRLVVTDRRLVIVQGREVCRSWRIDELPYSLLRYRMMAGGGKSWSVDLDSLQTMLGGSSEHFAASKSILAFGKQLDHIKARADDTHRDR